MWRIDRGGVYLDKSRQCFHVDTSIYHAHIHFISVGKKIFYCSQANWVPCHSALCNTYIFPARSMVHIYYCKTINYWWRFIWQINKFRPKLVSPNAKIWTPPTFFQCYLQIKSLLNCDIFKTAESNSHQYFLFYSIFYISPDRAPRFMIKQQVHVNPDRHYLYHHLKLIQPSESPYPNPPVTPLLPLRPKTCIPRVRKANDVQINDLFSEQVCVVYCLKIIEENFLFSVMLMYEW